MSEPLTPAQTAAAEWFMREYDSQYDASGMTAANFAEEAREVVTEVWPSIMREAAAILETSCSGDHCTRNDAIAQLRRLADQSEKFSGRTPLPAAHEGEQDHA
jgi:hypothetical protein